MSFHAVRLAVLAVGLSFAAASGAAVDEEAALALAKQSKCTKCHSPTKKKDGPSYKETAEKYAGKADAADKLYTHLTTSPMIKVDGKEEEHSSVKGGSEADIRNLVAYILSR